jgi:hypothetical protein
MIKPKMIICKGHTPSMEDMKTAFNMFVKKSQVRQPSAQTNMQG